MAEEEYINLKAPKINWDIMAQLSRKFVDLAAFAITYIFLLSVFQPQYLLADTYTTGGDMGSHMYTAKYMRDYLVPNYKLMGWSMDWYAGFPAFEYYFPLPFFMIALLSYYIPFTIAFKLITVSGVFLLPVCGYLAMRAMKFKYPAPALSMVFSLVVLFNEEYSIWGGNIKSTLAGEFTFTVSFALTVLFLGLFYRFVESGRGYLKASVVLAAVPLCHVYTLMWGVSSSFALIISKDRKSIIKRFNRMMLVYVMGFMLCAFWTFRIISKFDWATPFGAWKSQNFWEIAPNIMLPFYPLGVAAVILYIIRPRRNLGYLLSVTIVPIMFFAVINAGITEHLLDVRFMPFAYLGLALLGAAVLSMGLRKIKGCYILSIILLLLGLVWVQSNQILVKTGQDVLAGNMELGDPGFRHMMGEAFNLQYKGTVPSWVKWNYQGYEALSTWPGLHRFFETLDSLQKGRVVHEFSSDHSMFGTPRTLELIPFFTKHPVLEGLNIESSASSPFHFYMQSEYSKAATCPLSYMRCTWFNFPNAFKHFQYFAPMYVVASSPELKTALFNDPHFTLIANSEYNLDIYEINKHIPIVEVPKYMPLGVRTDDWRKTSMAWWKKPDSVEVPIVLLDEYEKVYSGMFADIVADNYDFSKMPKVEAGQCNVRYRIENERIHVYTSCPKKPHLVKVTYNPGWKVKGAYKVYLAGPSFMMVYPFGSEFVLEYGLTTVSWIGLLISYAGGLAVLLILISQIPYPPLQQRLGIRERVSDLHGQVLKWEDVLLNFLKGAGRYWKRAVVVVAVILVANSLYGQMQAADIECKSVCKQRGFIRGTSNSMPFFSKGDHYDMGFENHAENERHLIECTSGCDQTRLDFVYVNFGSIKFRMSATPNKMHKLAFRYDDSHWCRHADVFINGQKVGELNQGDGTVGWTTDFILIDSKYITSDEVEIEISHNQQNCWGMDISDVWLDEVDCDCLA